MTEWSNEQHYSNSTGWWRFLCGLRLRLMTRQTIMGYRSIRSPFFFGPAIRSFALEYLFSFVECCESMAYEMHLKYSDKMGVILTLKSCVQFSMWWDVFFLQISFLKTWYMYAIFWKKNYPASITILAYVWIHSPYTGNVNVAYLSENGEGIDASSVLEKLVQQLGPLLPLNHAHQLCKKKKKNRVSTKLHSDILKCHNLPV